MSQSFSTPNITFISPSHSQGTSAATYYCLEQSICLIFQGKILALGTPSFWKLNQRNEVAYKLLLLSALWQKLFLNTKEKKNLMLSWDIKRHNIERTKYRFTSYCISIAHLSILFETLLIREALCRVTFFEWYFL